MPKISYNFRLLAPSEGRLSQQAAAERAANKEMIPENGSLLIAYDKLGVCWYAQYRNSRLQQVGWLGQGRTALAALQNLESLNYPNPSENDADLLNGNPS